MAPQKLTDDLVRKLPHPSRGQTKVRDSMLPGFFVIIGTKTKSFACEADTFVDRRRKSIRKTVGRFPEVTTRQARHEAQRILGSIKTKRITPIEKRRQGPLTLGNAWAIYRESHLERKGRSPRTIGHYGYCLEHYLPDWLDKPLHELAEKPEIVRERHDYITRTSGPYVSNRVMAALRALFNYTRKKLDTSLGANPVDSIDFNVERRRDTGMGPRDVEAWYRQLDRLSNPVRRCFHEFLLLSGSRPGAAKVAKWEDIDLEARTWFIGSPKGGTVRAFTTPLSRPLLDCLARVHKAGEALCPSQSWTWVFSSTRGHLVEHKERRSVLSHWGGDLRQTYRNFCQVAEIPELDTMLLMNHAVVGTSAVSSGYITRSALSAHLLACQEKVSACILHHARRNVIEHRR